MKRMTTVLALILVLALMAATLVSAQRFKPGDDTIATIAVENGSFTTLVAALSCTNLVGAALNWQMVSARLLPSSRRMFWQAMVSSM